MLWYPGDTPGSIARSRFRASVCEPGHVCVCMFVCMYVWVYVLCLFVSLYVSHFGTMPSSAQGLFIPGSAFRAHS